MQLSRYKGTCIEVFFYSDDHRKIELSFCIVTFHSCVLELRVSAATKFAAIVQKPSVMSRFTFSYRYSLSVLMITPGNLDW